MLSVFPRLTDCIYDHEILPNDFVLYRKDRPSRGGGVLIAIKASICSSQLPSPPDIEVISIKVGSVQEFVLSSVYIPPNASTSHVFSLVVYLTSLTSSFRRCIFAGDYNFPDIDWSTLTGSSLSSSIFCEFIFDCNLRWSEDLTGMHLTDEKTRRIKPNILYALGMMN